MKSALFIAPSTAREKAYSCKSLPFQTVDVFRTLLWYVISSKMSSSFRPTLPTNCGNKYHAHLDLSEAPDSHSGLQRYIAIGCGVFLAGTTSQQVLPLKSVVRKFAGTGDGAQLHPSSKECCPPRISPSGALYHSSPDLTQATISTCAFTQPPSSCFGLRLSRSDDSLVNSLAWTYWTPEGLCQLLRTKTHSSSPRNIDYHTSRT